MAEQRGPTVDVEVCECGHEVAEHYDIDHGGPCAVCDCDEFEKAE